MHSSKLSTLLTSLLAATPITQAAQHCLDEGKGVKACITVTWTSHQKASMYYVLSDTKGDDHGVYVKYQVYLNGKGGSKEKLRSENGVGSVVSDTITFFGHNAEDVTGVRFWGCVDTWGGDTCTSDRFVHYGE